MAERRSKTYSLIFAVIALVLGWVIVRDYILEPDGAADQPPASVDAPDAAQ